MRPGPRRGAGTVGGVNDHTFTVSELTSGLAQLFQQAFPQEVWVQGEIRSLNRSRVGHVYFDLVDEGALGAGAGPVLPIVLFDSTRQEVNTMIRRSGGGIKMSDGVKVRVRGRIDYYPAQSRVQLRMSMIDPVYTLGRLTADRQALLDALAAENLLDRNAGLPLDAAPLRVALITSHGSAAFRDFVDELSRSGLAWEVRSIDTRVQGLHAPQLIAAALRLAGDLPIDVIALVRGGGARTDLAVFDHELVARAIAAMPVPVLTGIGHETDRSVADEVAHSAFKTPTACAIGLISRAQHTIEDTERTWAALLDRSRQTIDRQRSTIRELAAAVSRQTQGAVRIADHRLTGHAQHLGLLAEHRLREAGEGLDRHGEQLGRDATAALRQAGQELERAETTLRHLDPARALARGWSITRTAQGHIVRDPAAIAVGTELHTTVSGGLIVSTVDDARDHSPTENDDGTEEPGGTP